VLALPDKPSIAVLPFQNMSSDPEQDYFVDGMVEEIITALSRIRWLFVIARNSTFTYKGQAVDVKQVGREALRLLDRAIAIDRHYGPALSWTAMCHLRLVIDGWAEEPETNRRKGIDFARQALQVGGNDPGILANAAFVLASSGEDLGAMIGLVDRALAINPSYARGWFRSGDLRLWAGQHDLAIEHAETALRLSPREPIGTPLCVIGEAYFFKRQFDEAAAKLLLSIQDHPGYPPSFRFLAACYAHMGHLDDARAIVARLRVVTSRLVPNDLPFRNPEDRELLLSGLRLAMGDTE
jgi:tetratricopeptide (TPR) repeat protein